MDNELETVDGGHLATPYMEQFEIAGVGRCVLTWTFERLQDVVLKLEVIASIRWILLRLTRPKYLHEP